MFSPEEFSAETGIDIMYSEADKYAKDNFTYEEFEEVDGLCIPEDSDPESEIMIKRLLFLLVERDIDTVILNTESRKKSSQQLLRILSECGINIHNIDLPQEQQIIQES